VKRSHLRGVGKIGNALAMLSLVALVTACGGSSGTGGTGGGVKGPQNALVACPQSTNSSAAAAESGNITLNVTGWSSTTAEDALVKQGFDNFTKKYPNIKVNWTPIPDAYDTKMRANVAAGSVADVFYVDPSMAQQYIPSGKLLDLSPYMARDHVAASDFYDSLVKPFACADGTIYGLPKDWNALGLFYNKTMFQQAGIGDPTNWSWSDMQAAAQKLTKPGANAASTVYGLSTSADASRWLAFLFADGGKVLSSDGKSAAFNDSTAVQAMDFYTSFRKNNTGAMPKDIGAGWNGEAFGKQQAAMALEGGWLIPYLAQTYPNVQYGIAPLPMAPNGKRGNLLYTNAWGAYAQTSHPDAAWKLVQYMTGADYQQQVLRNGFALPTIKSLTNDSYFGQNPGFKTLLDGAQYGTADFYGAADQKVHDEIANAIESVMLGKSSSADALNTAAQNVNTFIQQNLPPS
jgi:multiple sugar transport system substrate-binding protein